MIRPALLGACAVLLIATKGPPPPPGGALGTLELGHYACEVPSPQDVTRGRRIEGADFNVVTTSSYRAEGVMGSYLRTGDNAVFSSGPRKGERYRVVSAGHLQAIDAEGHDGRVRCLIVGARKR